MVKKNYKWLLPIVLLALLAPFTPALDLRISHFFYDGATPSTGHFVKNSLLDAIYNYATLPADAFALLASFVLVASYFRSSWKKWRSSALFLVLTLVIGAGFITHALLKDHWGRPRPKQTIEFGGTQPFRPFYQPNFFQQPEPSKSFPCGHCTMGFYFFAAALLAKRNKQRALYAIALRIALLLGTILGVTRIAQGGHFLSDVLVSALVMWLTSLTLEWLIFSDAELEI